MRNTKKKLSRGQAWVERDHIINCNAIHFLPDNCEGFEEHAEGRQLVWNASNVKLHLDFEQKRGYADGHKLRKALKDQPVLNAAVLNHLLANQHLLPKEWEEKTLYFWGTIYRTAGGLCVPYLRCDGGWNGWRMLWRKGMHGIDGVAWGADSPAVIRAS